jgi:tellurite resistance protein
MCRKSRIAPTLPGAGVFRYAISMAKAQPKPATADLEAHADEIRRDLQVPRQSDVFRCAVEAGYLAAQADGEVDPVERATIVKAVEILSVGAVVEWETEALLDACVERGKSDGVEKRAKALGAELKGLGQAEAGLLFAALVARATKGIDKREAEVLRVVATAAGVSADALRAIVKRATSLGE